MKKFDLDLPLIELRGDTSYAQNWTAGNAVEGVQIFGGIGSGKTSGSGRIIALKYLAAGFGGLVLTVKPDEKELWKHYCELTGRSDDLIIVEPGGENYFDFLDYESTEGVTENIVQVLKAVIRASDEKDHGASNDKFWDTALDLLIFNVIDLCKLAYGKVTIQKMFDIVQALGNVSGASYNKKENVFLSSFKLAQENALLKVQEWENKQSPKTLSELKASPRYNETLCNAVTDARVLKFIDQFFLDYYLKLNEKTRSIIDFSFSGFLFRLLRDPVYSLFCNHASTFSPDDSIKGKIILLNLPVKLYHKIGRDSQIMFKYIWQRAMEKRKIEPDSRPVFLFADEAQNFIHEHDTAYQATARSSMIATVYITQNLPNYLANIGGGGRGDSLVKSFLGTLNTKIFHANADTETNRYASEFIGDVEYEETSRSMNIGGDFTMGRTKSLRIDRAVRPEAFAKLKTGGPLNMRKVEAFIHVQGLPFKNELNFTKIQFNQNFQDNIQN